MLRYCTKTAGVPGVVFRVVELPSWEEFDSLSSFVEKSKLKPKVLVHQLHEPAGGKAELAEYPFHSLGTLDEHYLPF